MPSAQLHRFYSASAMRSSPTAVLLRTSWESALTTVAGARSPRRSSAAADVTALPVKQPRFRGADTAAGCCSRTREVMSRRGPRYPREHERGSPHASNPRTRCSPIARRAVRFSFGLNATTSSSHSTSTRLPLPNATSHADRRRHACPCVPAMQHSGGVRPDGHPPPLA
jgi:hypothetical protein